jgi:predicted DNA-binding transcriptional regulator AlpA
MNSTSTGAREEPAPLRLLDGHVGLAKYLGVCTATAHNWARLGTGPKFIRIGLRRVAYRVEDVSAWLASRENAPATPAWPARRMARRTPAAEMAAAPA